MKCNQVFQRIRAIWNDSLQTVRDLFSDDSQEIEAFELAQIGLVRVGHYLVRDYTLRPETRCEHCARTQELCEAILKYQKDCHTPATPDA